MRWAAGFVCLLPCIFAASLVVRRPHGASAALERCSAREGAVVGVGDPRSSSSVVLARVGARQVALVADADEHEILTFDLADAKLLSRTSVPGAPSQLLVGAGGRVYVTLRESSLVQVFDLEADAVSCARGEHPPRAMLRSVTKVRTSTEPVAMALTPDRKTLLVLSGWGHALEGFAVSTHERSFGVDLPREPRGLVVDARGTTAFVSHASGPGATSVDLLEPRHVAHTIALEGREGELHERKDLLQFGSFDSGLFGSSEDLGFGFGAPLAASKRKVGPRHATQGFSLVAISTDGAERILIPEVLVQPGKLPEPDRRKVVERPTGYGTFADSSGIASFGAATGHIAAIDVETETVVRPSMVLTTNDTPCLLPRAALADPVRQTILVACLGTNEVDEYDARASSPSEALVGRWKVASGPTGLAIDTYARLVVWSSFERVLAIVDRDDVTGVLYGSPTRGREATPFEVGRKIFHSTDNSGISSDGRTCASCHPDGRDDGLTWITPDGPRQTPTLAGRLALTAPFGWTGSSETVREHLQQTLKRLGGRGLTDVETYALLTYLSRMKPPPTPQSHDGPKVARGKAIFTSDAAGCSGCHVTKGGHVIGDGEGHDVGSIATGDRTAMLSTPSLQLVGGTAPYFHDGRYATLRELLRGTDGNMGSTGHLSDTELDALTTYLETL